MKQLKELKKMIDYNYTLKCSRLNELIIRVEQWHKARGILDGSTVKTQTLKLAEELEEFAQTIDNRNKSKAREEFGDILVVMIGIACLLNGRKNGIDFIKKSLKEVIKKIEARDGKMVNGMFEKKDKTERTNPTAQLKLEKSKKQISIGAATTSKAIMKVRIINTFSLAVVTNRKYIMATEI